VVLRVKEIQVLGVHLIILLTLAAVVVVQTLLV
jgi:hypothetical protein